MSTSAERQRNRRRRLRRQGIVDVTVPVPKARRSALREFARALRAGAPAVPPVGGPTTDSPHAPLLAVIKALKAIRPELMEAGVRHAGVFGSAARGDYRPGSDIDIALDLDAGRVGDIVAYAKIAERIKDAVRTRCPDAAVDVADRATLKPRVRERVERDAVYAF
jgi:hypothetical protein